MPGTVTSIEDAVASIHAGTIADYLTAALVKDREAMKAAFKRAEKVDARHPGAQSLVDQLAALRVHAAA